MTIAPGNVNYTFDAVKAMIDEGYSEINLNCVYEEGWTVDHARILYEELKRLADYMLENDYEDRKISIFDPYYFRPKDPEDNGNWSGGDGKMIAVDFKGDLYPCLRYMESSIGDAEPAYKIGDVYNGLSYNIEEAKRIECLKCITRRSQSDDECFSCPVAEGCSYCSAYKYQTFGTPQSRA